MKGFIKGYSKYLITGSVALVAVLLVLFKYWGYAANPWTRNGQVRAEIIQITPRVSGPIIQLHVEDNQFVKAGDLLFEIDPRTFKADLFQAQAEYDKSIDNYLAQEKQVEAAQAQVESAKAAIAVAESGVKEVDAQIIEDKAEFIRQKELLPQKFTSQKEVDRAKANYDVSMEKKQGKFATLQQAIASLSQVDAALAKAKANLGETGEKNASIRAAKASLEQAQLNLEFTQVRASVDGYITNLTLQIGSQAVQNKPFMALIDVNSFWIHGYFKETDIGNVQEGNKATVTLMTYPDTPIEGVVDSLGWGVAQQDGSTGAELLPNVSPTFEWIRLAQRIPVRIHLTKVPKEIYLRVGTTASVLVYTQSSIK